MVHSGIIMLESRLTEVCSHTYPQKPVGTFHACFNHLNKAILHISYKAPTLNKISHHLSRTQLLSKLDVKNRFCSVHYNEPSSLPTIFNMHKGGYWFLTFHLKMSQNFFQMQMDQTTDKLPCVNAIHSDVCIFGKATQEHNNNLIHLMQTATGNCFVFNSKKLLSHNLKSPSMP